MEGGQFGHGWSEQHCIASDFGKATGHEPHTGIMILALAMGHTVERPVMGMGGGTIKPMERLPAAV
jgi:hypothetical protein